MDGVIFQVTEWSLTVDGQPVSLSAGIAGTLDNAGGSVKFNQTGTNVLTASVTDGLGRLRRVQGQDDHRADLQRQVSGVLLPQLIRNSGPDVHRQRDNQCMGHYEPVFQTSGVRPPGRNGEGKNDLHQPGREQTGTPSPSRVKAHWTVEGVPCSTVRLIAAASSSWSLSASAVRVPEGFTKDGGTLALTGTGKYTLTATLTDAAGKQYTASQSPMQQSRVFHAPRSS